MKPGTGANFRIALIAGEASGDRLGARLIARLTARSPELETFGIGGPEMEAQGFVSGFPMSEIAVMGPLAILARIGHLRRRLLEAVEMVVEGRPHALVIIDCPEFSHRVASRVRARSPHIPIIDYVAPSVWAWRPGRARAMRRYVDQVLALMPFEPEVYRRLGGPPCLYVGHPAAEAEAPDKQMLDDLRARIGNGSRPILAVMPGSRHNEIKRHCEPFGEAVALLARSDNAPSVVMPTLPHLRADIERDTANWPVRPLVVCEPRERHAAIVLADAAIVASGTATLELALARTPMVVGYRTEPLTAWLRKFITVHSIVLANLVHGASPIPEFYQGGCTGERLAEAVVPLLGESEERDAQLAALDVIANKVEDDGVPASERAAQAILHALATERTQA